MPEKYRLKHNIPTRAGDLVAIGRVEKIRGLRGELKIESLSDIPDRFSMLREVFVEFVDGSVEAFSIVSMKMRDNGLFIMLHGVESRSEAEKFRGAYLCVDSSAIPHLPLDTYYEFDLMGMEVRSPGGEFIGTVIRIERYPANDVIVVDTDGGEMPVPALKNIVRNVDLQGKRLTMDIPEGLPVNPKGLR